MTLTVLPDVELLTVNWLADNDEIANLYPHIGTEIPAGPTLPIIRVVRVGGGTVVSRWLDGARVQIDVWAEHKQAAHDLARLVQAVMDDMPGLHDEGVVTAVDAGVFRWAADEDTGWAGYTTDFLIHLHPGPAGS